MRTSPGKEDKELHLLHKKVYECMNVQYQQEVIVMRMKDKRNMKSQ